MVAISGQNVDDFMKEMEVVQKKMDTNRDDEQKTRRTIEIDSPAPPGIEPEPMKAAQIITPSHPTISVTAPIMIFPGASSTGMRVPPGPPPGRPLMPPGPPPGIPPPRLPLRIPHPSTRMIRIPGPPPPSLAQATILAGTPNVLSAGPQLINRLDGGKTGATITAKPQIRNLSADVTRFVPSTLRVKREDKKSKPSKVALMNEFRQRDVITHTAQKQPTKDDAYSQFMKEMQGLL